MFCLGMTGCTNHYSEEEIDDTYNGSVYLTLHINTALKENTRSNPNGGEFGDGDEIGVYNENTIDKLVFFFFRADQATGGIDHSDKPENIEVITEFCEAPAVINQSNRLEWSTQPIELKNIVAGYEYYMVVVANAYSFQMSDIKTLKDLQDYQFTDNLWQTSIDITNYNRFIMTSRFRDAQAMAQAKVSITYANDQTNPASGIAHLERLAARVDIIPKTEKNGAT